MSIDLFNNVPGAKGLQKTSLLYYTTTTVYNSACILLPDACCLYMHIPAAARVWQC